MVRIQVITYDTHTPDFYRRKDHGCFQSAFAFGKRPPCPDGFNWREEIYQIITSLEEWVDFTRQGRMARNMSTEHAAVAEGAAPGGLVVIISMFESQDGRLFHIYYDRAPKDLDDRMGEWFLVSELVEDNPDPTSRTRR